MYKIVSILLIAFIAITGIKAQGFKNVDSKVFSELINSKAGIILDVRTAREYSQGHIKNSTLISTSDPKFVEKANLLQKNKAIYIYCLTGSRSRAVANYLVNKGFSDVYNLQRGVLEWQRYGYQLSVSENPIASKSKTYSQVEFNQLINSKSLVLVDFHAQWCAPCKKMSPIIEEVKKKYTGKAGVEKIDIQANNALKNSYNVESIPGLILFKNGKEIWKHTGIISYADLSKVINQNL